VLTHHLKLSAAQLAAVFPGFQFALNELPLFSA